MWPSTNNKICICLLVMRQGWSKACVETGITRNYVNGVSLFNLSYLITLLAYLSSQGTPNVQIKYFMFDWSIYRVSVLNTGLINWLFQIMKCVHICSTWSIVELQTRFETWITRNNVRGLCMFNLTYLIIIMAYLCSWRTPNVQINYFVF
jgi:hypothetical protein